jgi:hypothetical protein
MGERDLVLQCLGRCVAIQYIRDVECALVTTNEVVISTRGKGIEEVTEACYQTVKLFIVIYL